MEKGMKNKQNLIAATSTLCLTFFTLIVVCVVWFKSYGWFSENKEVSANGISVSSQSPSINSINIKYYSLSENKENEVITSYTKGENITVIPNYNDASVLCTATLIEISINVGETGVYNMFYTCANPNIYDSTTVDLNTFTTENGISSICQLFYVDQTTYVKTNEVFSFIDGANKVMKTSDKSVNLTAGDNTVYFIIDYNEDNVSVLYNYMLSKFSEANLSTDMSFKGDLGLVVTKG